jgi:hypothetical protein
MAVLGISFVEVLRALVINVVQLPAIRLLVTNFATVVACSTELALVLPPVLRLPLLGPAFL